MINTKFGLRPNYGFSFSIRIETFALIRSYNSFFVISPWSQQQTSDPMHRLQTQFNTYFTDIS